MFVIATDRNKVPDVELCGRSVRTKVCLCHDLHISCSRICFMFYYFGETIYLISKLFQVVAKEWV